MLSAQALPRGRSAGLLEFLARPHWVVAAFVLMAAAALAISHGWADATAALPLPLGILVVNLAAAIATRPRFRADVPLLILHLALLVFVALIAVARLTYFDGGTSLSSGDEFEGDLVWDERGPFHPDRLASLRFVNEGFTENFPQRGRYATTYNRVRWWDANGLSHVAEIGDDRPLLLGGYRIYPTGRRGFSPVLHWQPREGEGEFGAVQLHDTRRGEFADSNQWRIPGGPEVWTMLDLPAEHEPQPGERRAGLGADEIEHSLVLRVADERYTMRPGDILQLPEGSLGYLYLDTWMGYRITYDPTKPWVAGTVLLAVICLVWFYLRRFRRPVVGE